MIAEDIAYDLPPMPTEAPENEPFQINNEEAADWYVSKLAAITSEMSLLHAQHEQRMTRLQSDLKCLQNLFQHQAEQWARQQIARDKRGRRSIILPHGTLQLRLVPGGVKVSDVAAAMEFALQSRPEAVRTVQSLDTTAYRQWAESRLAVDGEIIPGVEYLPDRESFSIKFGGGK